MSEDIKAKLEEEREKELDSFWDISELLPKKQSIKPLAVNTEAKEIEFMPPAKSSGNSSTVIKRYVDPRYKENQRIMREAYVVEDEYSPQNSLLHKVVLKKSKSKYDYYREFLSDAERYRGMTAEKTEYLPFNSYVPQYAQLSASQLSYYLWWRRCFEDGVNIKTDLGYIRLYTYELINIADASSAAAFQALLARLWNYCNNEFPAFCGQLAMWICDFSLIHRLPPPSEISGKVIRAVHSLKEFYISMPDDDLDTCVMSVLKYGTEFDKPTGKLTEGNYAEMFKRYSLGAVAVAVKFYSEPGRPLGKLVSEDSMLTRCSYEGAVCAPKNKYMIEVRYCSLSRSNELRFLMGDVLRYTENHVRRFAGVRSKLTVYSVGGELQKALDSYFLSEDMKSEASAGGKLPTVNGGQTKKEAYDVLYELPKVEFSLDNAKRIEDESWNTTNDLISAFEQSENEEKESPAEIITAQEALETFTAKPEDITAEDREASEGGSQAHSPEDDSLRSRLGQYLDFVLAVRDGNKQGISNCAEKLGQLPEAVLDKVNEIAADLMGDILIEEGDEGLFVLECYRELI